MLHILQVGDVLLSPDILTEFFSCDLQACRGQCCVEGEAGAPITLDEVAALEAVLPHIEADLSSAARRTIKRQGVADVDPEGDLVTATVGGRDCVFTCHEGGCCLCAAERAFRQGRTKWCKPASCALYPIRAKQLPNALTALNYNRWDICAPARRKGRAEGVRVYEFLRGPLTERFGQTWYDELLLTVDELRRQGLL